MIVLSLVIVAIGIGGTYLCKSPSLQSVSFLALGLNLNWFIGYSLAHRVQKELLRVQYTNLNGQTGFDLLMAFCQLQILLMIFIYLFTLNVVRHILIELKEMDLLSLRDNGAQWEMAYDTMPL